jgi:DNA helicase HerA-like ATPase
VGVYFVTQSPLDIPEDVLGQLGHRIQHALRAFTPKDQKAVKAAAETFRANPKLKVAELITQLEVGEALVSVLDEKGSPTPVERAYIVPPGVRLGPVTPAERARLIAASPLAGRYERTIDRESAYEILRKRAETASSPLAADAETELPGRGGGGSGRRRETVAEAMIKSAARAIGSQIGRQIIRGVLGSLLGGTRSQRWR